MKLMVYAGFLLLLAGLVAAPVETFFDTGNIYGVTQGECILPSFTLTESTYISSITDYHWNYGGGSAPGTISLIDESDNVYGPWPAQGAIYWTVNPDITVPAGTYRVNDSQMSTWAYNAESGNVCMSWGTGYPNPLPDNVPEFGAITLTMTALGCLGLFLLLRRRH